jgi:hypothetical protein
VGTGDPACAGVVSTGEGKRKASTPLMEKKIRREAFLHGGKAVGEGNGPGTGKGG